MLKFGTDGIRAKEEFFSADFLRVLAHAIFARYGKIKVYIARDTRLSGERIQNDIEEGLLSYGIKVYHGSVMPTPVLAYLTRAYGCDLGIMISASHNPPEYNGIKLFDSRGAKLPTAQEKEIEALLKQPCAKPKRRENAYNGGEGEEYYAYLKSLFGERLKGLRVLLDTCHGATCSVAPEAFKRLGAAIKVINGEEDGNLINVDCGATSLKSVIEEESKGKFDLAFAYDGDGDRVMAVKNGKVIDGDRIIYVISGYLEHKKRLEPKVAVGTVMSNLGLERALEGKGIELIRADVGDKYVYEKMLESGAIIGGEASGHVILRDYAETGDGLLTSLMLALADREVGIEKLLDMVDYPSEESFVEATDEQKALFKSSREISDFIENLSKEENVRVVVRPSGTEPKIRVMAEAERYEKARETVDKIKAFIKTEFCRNTASCENKQACLGIQNTVFVKEDYDKYQKGGVTVIDPATTFIEEGVKIGEGSVIYPFNVIRGQTEIGKNTTIYSYCDITDTVIGSGVDVRSSYSLQATIGDNCTVGPFATLRKGAVIGKGCRVGDYVEVKNSTLGDGVKAAHLSYIGDASVGAKTNVGCGTVFANYNGKIKRRTEVGEGVFIGCNTNLIAPIKVGDNSYIAGGSTITEDVPSEKFTIARVSQEIFDKRK